MKVAQVCVREEDEGRRSNYHTRMLPKRNAMMFLPKRPTSHVLIWSSWRSLLLPLRSLFCEISLLLCNDQISCTMGGGISTSSDRFHQRSSKNGTVSPGRGGLKATVCVFFSGFLLVEETREHRFGPMQWHGPLAWSEGWMVLHADICCFPGRTVKGYTICM